MKVIKGYIELNNDGTETTGNMVGERQREAIEGLTFMVYGYKPDFKPVYHTVYEEKVA